jgi:hypothetical protein
MCTPYMSNYYLYEFLEIINNKKIKKSNEDMYILHIKRYVIKTCIELERQCIICQKNYI